MRAGRRSACVIGAVVIAAVLASPAGLVGQSKSAIPAKPDDRTIVHVLNRLGFGPAPGDVEQVRKMGLQTYIERQLAPERIDDGAMTARLARFTSLDMTAREMAEAYFLPAQMARRNAQRQQNAQSQNSAPPAGGNPQNETSPREMMTPQELEAVRGERQVLMDLMQAKVLRAAYSERQLEEVMVDFWFNHFNVFSGKGQVRLYLTAYEADVIRPHVLGKFRDLLQATAESPAMLFYLDNWQSAAPENAATNARQRPFARRGQLAGPRTLADLPPAAQNRRRGLNENYARELMELHTLGVDGGYTQKDVQEVARAFTGWTIANPRQGGSFRFEPRMHDDGEKLVLGHKIKAGGGKKDGDQIIELLASHPSTARFIATKLARRFIADVPPKAVVDRAAARFRETGGDIREVVRAIVTSREFVAPDAYRAKVKTPFEFVVSTVRVMGAETDNAQPLVAAIRTLGMPLYGCQPPTGYADTAEAWVNTGALLNRMNFAVSLTSGARPQRGDGLRPVPGRAIAPVTITSDELVASALAGELSESTAATVARATTTPQALALVLGSPEFQRK